MTPPYQTWHDLEHHVRRRLATLALDDAVILDAGPLFVQFTQETWGLFVSAASNNSLPADAHLSDEQNTALTDVGWLLPELPFEALWSHTMPWPPTAEDARGTATLITTTLHDIFATADAHQITVQAFNIRRGTPIAWKYLSPVDSEANGHLATFVSNTGIQLPSDTEGGA